MIEIVEITPSSIELKGVRFKEGEKVQKIMDICHKYKHLYKEGYPCGRKTRKKQEEQATKWKNCPEICFTYLVTDDNAKHHLMIRVLVTRTKALLKRYSENEIEYFMQMYTQNVADEIISL